MSDIKIMVVIDIFMDNEEDIYIAPEVDADEQLLVQLITLVEYWTDFYVQRAAHLSNIDS